MMVVSNEEESDTSYKTTVKEIQEEIDSDPPASSRRPKTIQVQVRDS
jgi:hypothetical protein